MTLPGIDIPDELVLESTDAGLELRQRSDRPGNGVRADLSGGRRGTHPLARALRGAPGVVVDATAGFGGDAGVLAALGRSVLAIERNPALFTLLEDAHRRLALEVPTRAEAVTLRHGDARDLLSGLESPWNRAAAIVLDPMYPGRRSASALPPKPMQLLRALLRPDGVMDDVETLIASAFRTEARRVVLKRPPEAAPPEGVGKPTFSIESKLVRWDVWERG